MMMNEKQFSLNMMKKPSEIEMDGRMISKYDVVKKLNEQQDIIQSLQKDIIEMSDSHQSYIEMESETRSQMNDIIRTQRRKIFRLEKENKQLKEESKQEIYVFRKYPFYEGSYPVIISFDYQKVKEAFDNEKKEEGYGYYIKKIPLNTPLQITSGKTIEHIEIDYDGEVREWNGEKFVVK